MANFTFIIGEGSPTGSPVAWVEAKDDAKARELARDWLNQGVPTDQGVPTYPAAL